MEALGSLALLTINDLKSIDVAEVKLSKGGEFVSLEGDNGVGKSTVMEAIETLFNGGSLPPGMIRKGKKEAFVEGTFDSGYRAKRRIRTTAKGAQTASLDLFRPDGGKVDAPQSVLKAVFAGCVTPTDMANSTGVTLYNAVVGQLDVDVEGMTGLADTLAETLSGFKAEMRVLGTKNEPEEKRVELAYDEERFHMIQDAMLAAREADVTYMNLCQRNKAIEQQIEALKLELASTREQAESLAKKANALPKLEEEYQILKDERDLAVHSQHAIKAWEEYDEWREKAEETSKKIEAAKANHEAQIKTIRDTLAATVGPGGVTVTPDRKVMVGEVAWENLAYSERLKSAALLQLNTLPEGKLPFLFIEHGESMNSAKRMEVAKAAIEAGATVFMEILNEEIDELSINSTQVVDPSWSAVEVNSIGMDHPHVTSVRTKLPVSDLTPSEEENSRKAAEKMAKAAPPTPPMPAAPPSYPPEAELDIF